MLGTVPSTNDRVVADCGDLYKNWSPALRAGDCHRGCLGGDNDGGGGDGGRAEMAVVLVAVRGRSIADAVARAGVWRCWR